MPRSKFPSTTFVPSTAILFNLWSIFWSPLSLSLPPLPSQKELNSTAHEGNISRLFTIWEPFPSQLRPQNPDSYRLRIQLLFLSVFFKHLSLLLQFAFVILPFSIYGDVFSVLLQKLVVRITMTTTMFMITSTTSTSSTTTTMVITIVIMMWSCLGLRKRWLDLLKPLGGQTWLAISGNTCNYVAALWLCL